MIVYLDTSAVVPLLVEEAGTAACRRLWDDADDVLTNRLTYVEAAAALAQARRLGRLTPDAHRSAVAGLDELWPQVAVVEIDADLVRLAADLADRCDLRGYDAVHCASGAILAADDVVAAAGDRRLLDAWAALGLATCDTNERPPE